MALLDQLDGMVEHASQIMNFAVVAKSPLRPAPDLESGAGLAAAPAALLGGQHLQPDYLAETPEGAQRPMLNVFHRDGETIRHFWGSELFYAPWDPARTRGTWGRSSRSGTSLT